VTFDYGIPGIDGPNERGWHRVASPSHMFRTGRKTQEGWLAPCGRVLSIEDRRLAARRTYLEALLTTLVEKSPDLARIEQAVEIGRCPTVGLLGEESRGATAADAHSHPPAMSIFSFEKRHQSRVCLAAIR